MRASKRGCSVKVMGYAPWRKRSGPPNKREAAIESTLMHQGQHSKTHFSIRLKPLPPVSNPRTQHHNQYDTCFRHGRDFFNTHSPLHSETPRIALLVGESSATGNEPFAATWTYRRHLGHVPLDRIAAGSRATRKLSASQRLPPLPAIDRRNIAFS